VVEEGRSRHQLFTRIDLAFVDATSLYSEGAGGQTLNQDSFGKNHRPDPCAHTMACLRIREMRVLSFPSVVWPWRHSLIL
jgi:hypothetical protein